MRMTQSLKLLFMTVLLLVITALLWWGIGYPLGRALLNPLKGGEAWRYYYEFAGKGALVHVFVFAFVVAMTLTILSVAGGQIRWLALPVIAFGAVLLDNPKEPSSILGVVLFVFAIAVAAEAGAGWQQAVAALAAALVVAVAFVLDTAFATLPQRVLVVAVRTLFFYLPLLLVPFYLEKYVLRRSPAKP